MVVEKKWRRKSYIRVFYLVRKEGILGILVSNIEIILVEIKCSYIKVGKV